MGSSIAEEAKTSESEGQVAGAGKVFDGLARRTSLHQPPVFLPNCIYLVTNKVLTPACQWLGLEFSIRTPTQVKVSPFQSFANRVRHRLSPGDRRAPTRPRLTKIWRVRRGHCSLLAFLHLSHSTAAACRHTLGRRAIEIAEAGLAATSGCSSAIFELHGTAGECLFFSSEFWFLICAMLIYCALYSKLPHYFYPLKLEMHHAKDYISKWRKCHTPIPISFCNKYQ